MTKRFSHVLLSLIFLMFILLNPFGTYAFERTSTLLPSIAIIVEDNEKGEILAKSAEFLFGKDRKIHNKIVLVPIKAKPAGHVSQYIELLELLKNKKITVGVSLLPAKSTPFLSSAAEKKNFPMVFLWGEGPYTEEKKGNVNFSFFMNFKETFRPKALALVAKKLPGKWSIFADRLDETSKNLAQITSIELKRVGIKDNKMFCMNPNSYTNVINALKESLATGHTNILTFLTVPEAIKLKQYTYRKGYIQARFISGWEMDKSPRMDGFFALSQEPSPSIDEIQQLKALLPSYITSSVQPQKLLKIHATLSWLSEILTHPVSSPLEVVKKIENSAIITTSNYYCQLSPKTHTPFRKTIYLLKYERTSWKPIGKFLVEKANNGPLIIVSKKEEEAP